MKGSYSQFITYDNCKNVNEIDYGLRMIFIHESTIVLEKVFTICILGVEFNFDK